MLRIEENGFMLLRPPQDSNFTELTFRENSRMPPGGFDVVRIRVDLLCGRIHAVPARATATADPPLRRRPPDFLVRVDQDPPLHG
mmetsp:Transcript_40921/g.85411  ORF Transcript_40921/g.85411 Transcript_40921/m.85411 type:complete len:85 (+) Transcript_40921:229-483(+)